MKITEIFDVQNSDSNLILGKNTYILIHDYDNYKDRLHDHSATLELLTQRALNLSLFRSLPQKLKTSKLSYHTKQIQKAKIEGVVSGELLVIKKLLLVNLRSFKIMQQLFQENKELQILLNDSRVFAKRQKQKIEYAKKQNESLKKTEIQLKKRLGSFLRQLNRVSRSFVAGFTDDHQNGKDEKISMVDDQNESTSQKLEFAFNFSTNVAYRLQDDSNKFLNINNVQGLSFSYDLDIILRDLKLRLTSELPLNNFFNTSFGHMHLDREIKYPLLTWEKKKCSEKTDFEELPQPKKEHHKKSKEISYKIDKDVQNAIRLHCVNSSIWKSFLLMKTIQEFIIFDQVYELVKAFSVAVKACESEASFETNETTLIHFENVNLNSFESETTSERISQISLDEMTDEAPVERVSQSSLDKMTDEAPDERIEVYPKKRYPRIKVFYSLKHIHTKIINGTRKKKPKRRISEKSFNITETISIGVGDSYIMSVDRECQFDNDIYIEPTYEGLGKDNSNVNFANKLNRKDSSLTTLYSGRHDFKKSLKSLEDVLKVCKKEIKREAAVKPKPKKKIVNNTEKKVNKQRKEDTKVKEVTKKSSNPADFYKKETRKNSRLPEMSKMYQIILQNRLPRGVSFEYLTPGKSKVQLLFVNNSRDPQAKKL